MISAYLRFVLVAALVSACSAPAAVPAEHDAGACVCELLWSRGPEIVVCHPRGDGCAADAVCVPVLPLTEDPSCKFAGEQ